MSDFSLSYAPSRRVSVYTGVAAVLLLGLSTRFSYLAFFFLLLAQLGVSFFLWKRRSTSFLLPVLLVQFCTLSLSKVCSFLMEGSLSPAALMESQGLLWGTLLTLCGYALLKQRFADQLTEMPAVNVNSAYLLVLMAMAGSVLLLSRLPEAIYLPLMQLQVASVAALAFFHSPKRSWMSGALQVFLLVVAYFFFLEAASLSFCWVILVVWAARALLLRRVEVAPALIATLLLTLVLQSVKPDFRRAVSAHQLRTYASKHNTVGALLKTHVFVQGRRFSVPLFRQRLLASFAELPTAEPVFIANNPPLLKATQRMADDSLARVIASTPHPVSYWEGESYGELFRMGQRTVWNDFGRRYEILASDDWQTAVQFNHLAEGYMNFGWWGLLGAGFLFGLLAALAEKAVTYAPASLRFVGLGLCLLPFVMGYDTLSLVTNFGMGVALLLILGVAFRSSSAKLRLGTMGFSLLFVSVLSFAVLHAPSRILASDCRTSAQPRSCHRAKLVSQAFPFRVWIP